MIMAETSHGPRAAGHGMPQHVRLARPSEHAAIAALLQRANSEYRDQLPLPIYHAYLDSLRALTSDPLASDPDHRGLTELLVVEAEGHIRGIVAFYPDARREGLGWPKNWAGLRALAVDPAARGQGLGRLLAEAAIRRARAIAAPVICLHNAPFQRAARALYRSLGFLRCPLYDFDVGDIAELSPAGDRLLIEGFALRLD